MANGYHERFFIRYLINSGITSNNLDKVFKWRDLINLVCKDVFRNQIIEDYYNLDLFRIPNNIKDDFVFNKCLKLPSNDPMILLLVMAPNKVTKAFNLNLGGRVMESNITFDNNKTYNLNVWLEAESEPNQVIRDFIIDSNEDIFDRCEVCSNYSDDYYSPIDLKDNIIVSPQERMIYSDQNESKLDFGIKSVEF